MRATLLLLLALATAATPATASAACRCGEPAGLAEEATTRSCPCCGPGECHCCCSAPTDDDTQPPAPRDGAKDCGCSQVPPRQVSADGVSLDAPAPAPTAVAGVALPPARSATAAALPLREARPPGTDFPVPLRI